MQLALFVKLIVSCVCINMFAVMRSSVRSTKSYHSDEARASSLSPVMDQVEELTTSSTPPSLDVEVLPKKFLNRNPRYVMELSFGLRNDILRT